MKHSEAKYREARLMILASCYLVTLVAVTVIVI